MDGDSRYSVCFPEDRSTTTVPYGSFHQSWERHANYLYENTSLSRRQAEVESLSQFGFKRQNIANVLDVSPNTVDDHSSKLKQKINWAQNERYLVLTPRDVVFTPFAPELAGSADIEHPDGVDSIYLFENEAIDREPDEGHRVEDVESPAYVLVFETTRPKGATACLCSEITRWFHPTFEHLVYNSWLSKPFPEPYQEEAVVQLLSIVNPTHLVGRLRSHRESLYEPVSDLYDQAMDDPTIDADSIATTFGLDPDFVEQHITDYQTQSNQ